jgi:hypothetical protein
MQESVEKQEESWSEPDVCPAKNDRNIPQAIDYKYHKRINDPL